MAMQPTDKSQVGTSRKWHKAKKRHNAISKKFNILHNNVPVPDKSPATVTEKFGKTGAVISNKVDSVGNSLRSAFQKFWNPAEETP